MTIKILICDDDKLIRESLKILLPLDSEIEVIAEAFNGEEAIEICKNKEVDVALIDIRMPKVNGVEAVKGIVKSTNTKCIILTTFDEEKYVNEALRYGARGYILKNNSPTQIINTIKSVYNETIVMNENILNKIRGNEEEPKISNGKFTEREIEVIKAIAEGLSNREISKKLFISEGTARNYITNILDKTELDHRTQIAIQYLKGNL